MATKLSADVSQFKRAMSEARAAAQALDSQMKLDEQTFKKTGDSQTYMANQTASLNAKLQNQQRVLEAANRAMAAMEKNGQKNSAAYNKVQTAANQAQYTINQLTDELNGAGEAADSSGSSMESMAGAMQNVSRRADFSAIISGLEGITSRAEAAGRKILQLGTEFYDTMKSAATWADDTSTAAMMEGLTSEEYQRMVRTAESIQTSVDDIFAARNRLQRKMGKDQMGALEILGIDPYNTRTLDWGMGSIELQGEMKGWEDILFEMGQNYKEYYTNAEKSAAAQELLGRSWQRYAPLWEAGRDAYETAKENATVNSEETVDTLSELSLAIKGVKGDFETLERNVLVAFAPGMTELANSLKGIIGQFNEYLQTEEGQEKMEALSESFKGLFDGLKDVDFGAALDTAKGAIDTLISSLEWVTNNKDQVITALTGIFGTFTGLKLTGDALKLVNALGSLSNLIGKKGLEAAGAKAASAAATNTGGAGFLAKLGPSALLASPFVLAADSFIRMRGIAAEGAAWKQDETQKYMANLERFAQTQNAALEYYKEFGAANIGNAGAKEGIMERLFGGVADLNNTRDNEWFEGLYDVLSDGLTDRIEKLYTDVTENGGLYRDPHAAADLINDIQEELAGILDSEAPKVDVKPMVDLANAQEQLDNAGAKLPVELTVTGISGMGAGKGPLNTNLNLASFLEKNGLGFASGLEYVPRDGFVASLHKGERILTAEENRNYGQMDPAALADAMEYAMSHVAVYMGSDRVGNLTTNRVQANIQRKQNARLRGYGA